MDSPESLPPTNPIRALEEGRQLFQAGSIMQARDALIVAAHAGSPEAQLELPTVLRFLGDTGSAQSALQRVWASGPNPLSKLRAQLEQGVIDMLGGHIRRAHEQFQGVWIHHAQLGSEGEQAKAALLLAYTSALLGRDASARHHLEIALTLATPTERVWALHVLSRMSLDSGHYAAAQSALTSAATLLSQAPVATASHHIERALLATALGEFGIAEQSCRHARAQAQTSGEVFNESLAAIQHAAVLTALGRWPDAMAALKRAECLCPNPYHRALIDLRLGALAAAQEQPHASDLLWRARATFTELELLRETAWCDLHLAAASLPDEAAALAALDRAMHARHALNRPCLLPELRLTPRLLPLLIRSSHPAAQVLQADRQAVSPGEPLLVELRTLGRPGVFVDGQEVRLGMRRTPEILTFLLLRGPATRAQLLAALWPDDAPRRATNYFHQAKRELARHVPWLQIRLDREQDTYALCCQGPMFQCDLHVLQRVLGSGSEDEVAAIIRSGAAPFLPDADTAWAQEERGTVEWSIMKSALGLMQRWSERGEYQKCLDLAARLLELDPCDEALVEHLVTATLELEGRAAAQRTLAVAAQRAHAELGIRPHWEHRLSSTLNNLN